MSKKFGEKWGDFFAKNFIATFYIGKFIDIIAIPNF
jgi:hypothetical protein